MKTGAATTARRAFTLLEIMTVVMILGLLGAIVIPQFTNTADDATETAVRAQLQRVRTAIEYYRARHQNHPPATIELLVTEDYLQQMPDHPGTLDYKYDAENGEYHSPLNVEW